MGSLRNYLTQELLKQYADIDIVHTDEADDQISQAEELIDSYVGFQRKFYPYSIEGKVTEATSSTLKVEPTHQNTNYQDFFTYCVVEILGGTGSGQRRVITSSTFEGIVTVRENWTITPDTTSFYHIYQVGKFPRFQDVFFNSRENPQKYYKTIPEEVAKAVAAQVQYVIEMGDKFFSTDRSNKTSESIGDYSYSKEKSSGNPLIAPKAKLLLHSIRNRLGEIVA